MTVSKDVNDLLSKLQEREWKDWLDDPDYYEGVHSPELVDQTIEYGLQKYPTHPIWKKMQYKIKPIKNSK